MIYEYFRATGAYEAAQGFADLFTICPSFRCKMGSRTVIISVSEMPSDPILEGLYESKLKNSDNGTPNYQQLKTAAKLHIDQMMREPGAMLWNEDQLPRVKKENKPKLKGKWENAFN